MDAQRRDWRERERAQREAWREHWREIERSGLPAPVPVPGGAVPAYRRAPAAAPVTSEPIEHQATRFRRKAIGSAMLLAFLGVINLVTMAEGVPIPWVVFPAWGIIGGLRRRWRPLAAVGLRFRDVMFGREGGVGTPAHPAQAGQTGGPAVEALVRRLHRRVYMLVGSAVALAMTIALAAGVDDDLAGLFIVTIPLFVFSAIGTIRRARAVRRAGVGVRDAMSSRWRRAVALADRRPRAAILSEEVARLAAPEVAAGPHGDALRQAVDDRVTVRDTLNRLPPEDRALIPDVLPTVDALVDRVAGLAGSLHRIDSDLPPDMLDHIDRRLAAARAEPEGTPDRARKVQLLERQRASMTDLLDRRAALAAQMESAQLVLQNIKLDLLKLRSSGVGAAIDDVSSATQEARALSRDIQYALEAAAEVRRG
jgi:serine/threonine-protein kinase